MGNNSPIDQVSVSIGHYVLSMDLFYHNLPIRYVKTADKSHARMPETDMTHCCYLKVADINCRFFYVPPLNRTLPVPRNEPGQKTVITHKM